MQPQLTRPVTAFVGQHRFATGTLQDVAVAAQDTLNAKGVAALSIYDDATGALIDVDPRGPAEEVLSRLAERVTPGETRGRGRPKLGVVAREVTLLPRHWDWLNTQPGGASVALRKLVDAARRTSGDSDRIRAAQEAAYRFMSSIAGDLPGFEEASRALFAYDRRRFGDLIAGWPPDIRDFAIKLAFADLEP